MDNKMRKDILDVQEAACCDREYLSLYAGYKLREERFRQLWFSRPPEEQKVIEEYLYEAARLHQRLLRLALDAKER